MITKSGKYFLRLFAFVCLVFLCVVSTSPAFAQSSARPSPVEVLCPKPPTAVVIEGRRVLVYELHVTNFGPSALTLTGIEVFADGSSTSQGGTKLGDYTGDSLSQLLRPVDETSQMDASSQMSSPTNPGQLPIGRRVIAFMYVSIPPGVQASALRHRLLFDVADPARGKGTPNDESALDGIIVPVLQQTPMVLSSPLKEGIWLAGNGPSNTSVHRRSVIAINGRPYDAQRFAIDWVMVGSNGNTFHDSRERNENFWAFGEPVLAVADGEVTEVVNDIPDNLPGKILLVTVQNITGNHVIIKIAQGVFAMYAHLKQGSIRVHVNQKVTRGTELAQVGNSGNTTGAHLHFQVVDASSALASEGIPFVFDRFRFLGFGKDFEENRHPDLPRSESLPADDSVVSFQ